MIKNNALDIHHAPAAASPRTAIRTVIEAVFRHKIRVVSFFLLTTLATVAYVLFAPRAYESNAKMMLRVGHEAITLDPTATVSQTMMLQKTHESEINSALEILGSRGLVEKVVEKLGCDRILGRDKEPTWMAKLTSPVMDWLGSTLDSFSAQSEAEPQAIDGASLESQWEREQAVRVIMNHTTVSSPKESMVLSVVASAGSPKLAQDIAAAYSEFFVTQHSQISHTSGSYEFFNEQSDGLHQQLDSIQRKLVDRKKQFGLVTVAGKQTALEDRLRDAELSDSQTQRQIEYTRAKFADLEKTLTVLPKEVVTQQQTIPNSARDTMRSRLYDLEIRKSLLPYTADHPLSKAIGEQARSASSIVDDQEKERLQSTTGANPTFTTLEADLKLAQAELVALQSQAEVSTQQKTAIFDELVALNEQQLEIKDLERTALQLESAYQTHIEKREQARIHQALSTNQISNVNIVQPATYVAKATAPKKAISLLIGLFFATGGAIGLALVTEFLDPTLRSSDQVQATLELPVALLIPQDYRQRRELKRLAAGRQ